MLLFASLVISMVTFAGVSAEVDQTASAGYQHNGTVYLVNGKLEFKPGVMDAERGVAYGLFSDTLNTTGWGILQIESGYSNNPATGSKYSDGDIMTAAGYLEGCLTQNHIYIQFTNIQSMYIKSDTSPSVIARLKTFFNQQQQWMESQVEENPTDPFWKATGLILNQYMGLYKGYNAVAPSDKKLDFYAFQFLNYAGDLIELMHVVDKRNRPNFHSMSEEEFQAYRLANSHCSVLIKLLPGYEDIIFSHSTWFPYQANYRIYKFYSLSVDDFSSDKLSFSSYPGFLESWDDFYLMGNGLVMLQTTNGIYNTSLYDLISPESAPAWVRVRVANHMAANSSDWGYYLSQHNSGTYNNQYMILDLNKVKLNTRVEDHALYIIEQLPGLVEYSDQTDILRAGYWASYNVPFHETIFNRSGYAQLAQMKGPDLTHDLAPRAKIFRRDAGKVTDIDSMKRMMRYSGYKSDPYAEGDPCNTICCRGDLQSPPMAQGCYDTKVSNYSMGMRGSAWVINGQTTADGGDGNDLEPFKWSQFPNISHVGLPPVYNFPFIKVG